MNETATKEKATRKKASPKKSDKTSKVEKEVAVIIKQEKEKMATEEPKEEVKPEPETPFVTFCGCSFDPALGSDCYLECREATPEQYTRCVDHFKVVITEKPKRSPAARGGKKGKNVWGHLNGSQAELIDQCLLTAVAPISLMDIAAFANAAIGRTRHHIRHLQNDWKVKVHTADGKLFLGEKFPDLVTETTEGFV
jgi:hypothetical protein